MSEKQFPEFFSPNSPVEVSSPEEGFGGAWYQATVITLTPNKHKLFVEYKTLFADDNLQNPLREHIDIAFVRPTPPIYNNPTLFELYDVVDAFYKDGWWTGVITRIFQGSRFVVTFQNPPDELQFGAAGLRLHFDWVNGTWVRPRKQKIPGLMFGEGKEVEVLINIKHNQDVWYPAIIVENDADSSFLVEYMSLKEGTNETEHQKVTVDFSHIRPSPPPLEDRLFDLLEKVDALHELGWWSCILTKELPDNRYNVFFQSMKREVMFERTCVRPQISWRDGKWWFTSSQEEVTPCQKKPGDLVDGELNDTSSWRTCFNSKVMVNAEKIEQKAPLSSCSRESNPSETLINSPGTPKGVLIGANLEETEFRSSSLGEEIQTDHADLAHEKSHDFASSPEKIKHSGKITKHLEERLKRGRDADSSPHISSQQNTAMSDKQKGGIDSTIGSPPSNIPVENMLIDLNHGDQSSDNPSRGMRTPKKQKKMDAKENHTLNYKRKQGQAGEESNNGFTKLAVHVETDSGGGKADRPFIIGVESCKLSNSKAGKTRLNTIEGPLKLKGDKKKQLNDLPVQDKGSETQKSSHKKKRGRPRKVPLISTNAEMTEQISNTANDAMIRKDSTSGVDSHVAPDSMLIITGDLLPSENSLTSIGDSTRRISPSRMPTDRNDQALIGENERQMLKEATQRTTIENKVSQNLDADTMVDQSAKLRQTPQTRKELNRQITSSKDNKTVPIMNDEVDVQTRICVDFKTSITTTEEPELPFEKSSSLWEVIESMEAFQKMPQKPHFRPLQQYKESLREGFAIAAMVNFSSAVENISGLRFGTSKEKIDDILDSLKDLESHGFGVQVLRDRTTEMESIKEKHKELLEEVDIITKQIVSCNFDKADQDNEISEVTQQMKNLQERIAKAESIKEMKDHEIEVLESRRQEAEETIGSARRRYEDLASGVL